MRASFSEGKKGDEFMLCLPEAYKNIIVGVKWNGKFSWYVSLKEIWYLDKTELVKAYVQWAIDNGMPTEPSISESDERYGILVLNEKNVGTFLPRIAKYSATVNELREYLKLTLESESREDVFYDYLPSLYIDFDERVLYSQYTEPASFEDYVPRNWRGYYQDFLDMIEPRERFWQENNEAIFDFERSRTENE